MKTKEELITEVYILIDKHIGNMSETIDKYHKAKNGKIKKSGLKLIAKEQPVIDAMFEVLDKILELEV